MTSSSETVGCTKRRSASRRGKSGRGAGSDGPRLLRAFRIPRALYAELLADADLEDLCFTQYVVRLIDDFLHLYHLPLVVKEVLEADRTALGFRRYAYLQHVLLRRYESAAKYGPGFDRKEGATNEPALRAG